MGLTHFCYRCYGENTVARGRCASALEQLRQQGPVQVQAVALAGLRGEIE